MSDGGKGITSGQLWIRQPSPKTAPALISGLATVSSCTRRSAAPSLIAMRETCFETTGSNVLKEER